MPRPTLKAGSPIAVTLSGGGTRLYGHAGVLAAIEAAKLPIREILGVSGGGLVGAAYACLGMAKAAALMTHVDVAAVMRFGWGRNYGWWDNGAIATICENAGITWEAAAASGIELKIAVTALEPGLGLVWSADHHPAGMSLGEAIRIGASIPLLWGYTRVKSADIPWPPLPDDEKLPELVTLVDGGIADMLLPGDHLPWVASNVGFNGYRDFGLAGFADYLAQMLATMQYQAMQPALIGASAAIEHRHMRDTGWIDRFTPAEIVAMMIAAREEADGVLSAAMKAPA